MTYRSPPAGHPYSTTDLCRYFGLSTRTLRYYGAIELLPAFRRGEARFYSAADRDRLREILRLKRFGFTLQEIRELLILADRHDAPGYAARFERAAAAHLEAMRDRLAELQHVIPALEAERAANARRDAA
ncbi:DNA-binding transcriptional regulator, MerR family [Albimonas donghaensis]|uniref:DNA-binding transcriptional regulator, MerR family n=1 Tax=Albimonas donghaensis TaxID=356660 RepID=A0A1H3FFP6_9RHOB|nr:MerR family transcriptional regulator [Albimonas donghaensis]SDX89786.1 DNA-binding transcriptional regulator, MerR family [Albimonas donghaensis]